MIGKCARRAVSKPYLISALALFVGFVGGYVRRVPQVADKELIRYLRAQQMRRLFGRANLWDRQSPGAA
jgi:hypothetical protein